MKSRKPKIDHGFVEIKRLIRKRLVSMIEPSAAVDFFAGSGNIISSLYSCFKCVHAVEKDPARFALLVKNLDVHGIPVRGYCMDNHEFARKCLCWTRDVNLMDFDAYGNPHPLIRLAFRTFRPDQRTVVAVTDGGRISLCRGSRLKLVNYQAAPAGPASLQMVRARPPSAGEYEALLRSFWTDLAYNHGFTITDFMSAWAKGRRVIYYGVCIEPNRDRVDQNRAFREESLEPQQHEQGQY